MGFLDHCVILLQFDFEGVFCPYPFKFNAAWLDDPLFCDFVRQFWNNLSPRGPGSILKCFGQRLSLLQKEVQRWDIKMKRSRHSALVYLENKIDTLSALMDVDYFSVEIRSHLAKLEAERVKLLMFMEESWRLKSRALWLKVGDNNTRYFQNYANQRRLNNSIWDLTIDGSTICDQISLKVAALNHFKDVFTLKEKPGMLCQLET